ncbi:uncharacterized protein [Eurosta solidaginis]|uniref:uncharacterized protein isoform X2 n=1 Tax=Eurosta solidaginis TaxID=178769 RepID=UPI003530BAE8
MDKHIVDSSGKATISNDGATIKKLLDKIITQRSVLKWYKLIWKRYFVTKTLEDYRALSDVVQQNITWIKATTPAKEPVSCQRFSLDVEDVDQHESNVAVSGNAMNKLFEMEDENKSNNANTIKRIPYNFSTKASCDETIFECQQQRTSDESFMALEKMYDKTASDPNSTLFKYIHSENKDMVKEVAKKRSADGNYFKIPCKQELQEIDEEAQSLQRLLHDLCVQEQHQLDNETPLKSIDVTLLEDIEAPSKMWDSTIVGDTTLQTSPLKMVKLLRPSTILEENCEDQSNSSLGGDDASSHISFQSAQKGSETSATTSF